MQRVLEPEIMDDGEQVLAYASADFAASNQAFVDRLRSDYPQPLHQVLDIGCGPGDVMVRLARQLPGVKITAIDGSAEMLALAQKAVQAADCTRQVTLVQGFVPGLALPEKRFDAILSKDLLHHLPDPMVLWREAERLGHAGAIVYVMDLVRPASREDAHAIVERVAGNEHPILKEDFFNSLCAAFTPEEVRDQITRAGLALDVSPLGDRHMLIKGRLP